MQNNFVSNEESMPSQLTPQEINKLNESLHYCKIEELKDICSTLRIPNKGKKSQLITTIMAFITSETILTEKKIPTISCKQTGKKYPLHPKTLIVYGAYKNDLATRTFFKKLIGNHFHFTAFGQDWIKQQWVKGAPPTYAEFATFWQREYLLRKNTPKKPKPEWAYLNFVQKFKQKHPIASKNVLLASWEDTRLRHKKQALTLINKSLNSV